MNRLLILILFLILISPRAHAGQSLPVSQLPHSPVARPNDILVLNTNVGATQSTRTISITELTTNLVEAAAVNTNQLWVSGLGTVQDFNCANFSAAAGNGQYFWWAAKQMYTNTAGYGIIPGSSGPGGYYWPMTNAAHGNIPGNDIVLAATDTNLVFASWGDLCGNLYPAVTITYATNLVSISSDLVTGTLHARDVTASDFLTAKNATLVSAFIGNLGFPNANLYNLAFNNGSTLSNLNASSITDGIVTQNDLDPTNLAFIQIGAPSRNMNLNRWGWKNTIAKIRSGQPPLLLYLGSGLIDIDRVFMDTRLWNHLTNSGAMTSGNPLGTTAPTSMEQNSYHCAPAGGAYKTNDLTIWYDDSFYLPGSGSPTITFFTNSPTANVFEINPLGTSGGGTFKIQQNVNGGGFADVAGFTSVSTSAGSQIGQICRWTNGSALPTQVKVVYLSGGPVRVLAASYRWTQNTTNGLMSFHYTQQSSFPVDVVNIPTNIWVPVFQSWQPDMMLIGFAQGSAIYLTNFFNQFMTNVSWYIPNCDIVYQGLYPSTNAGLFVPFSWGYDYYTNGFGTEANYYAFMRCREKGYSYFDTYNLFGGTNVPARNITVDGVHLHDWASILMADAQIDWLGLMSTQPGVLTNQYLPGTPTVGNALIVTNQINVYGPNADLHLISTVGGGDIDFQSNPLGLVITSPSTLFSANVTANGIFTGDAQSVTNIKHANTVTVVSGGSVALTRNGDGSTNFAITITPGAGSQTPWTGDEDAAKYQLTNLSQLTLTNGAKLATGGNGLQYINPVGQTVISAPTNGNLITLGTNSQVTIDYLGNIVAAGEIVAGAQLSGTELDFTNSNRRSWLGPFTGPNATGISLYSTNTSIADFTGTNIAFNAPINTFSGKTAGGDGWGLSSTGGVFYPSINAGAHTNLNASVLAFGTVPIGVLALQLEQLMTNYVAPTVTNSVGQSVANGMTATNDTRALTLTGPVNMGTAVVSNSIIIGGNITETNATTGLLQTNATAAGKDWSLLYPSTGLYQSNGTTKAFSTLGTSNLVINAAANAGYFTLGDTASNLVLAASNYIFWTSNYVWQCTNGSILLTNTGAAGDFVQLVNSNVWAGGLLSAYGMNLSNYANIGGALFTSNNVNVGLALAVGGTLSSSNGGYLKGIFTNVNCDFYASNALVWGASGIDAQLKEQLHVSATNVTIGGWQNINQTGVQGPGYLDFSNSASGLITVTWPAGTRLMGGYTTNQPLNTCTVTNGKTATATWLLRSHLGQTITQVWWSTQQN